MQRPWGRNKLATCGRQSATEGEEERRHEMLGRRLKVSSKVQPEGPRAGAGENLFQGEGMCSSLCGRRVRQTESRRPRGGRPESPEPLLGTRPCFRPCSQDHRTIPSLHTFCPLSSCSWSCSPGDAQRPLPRAQSPPLWWAAPGGVPRWGPGCSEEPRGACAAQGSCLLTVLGSRSHD